MISHIQILQYIESFAAQHMQIQRFGADFYEQINNFATKDKNFPILYIVPIDNYSDENVKVWTYDAYCFDIIEKNRDNINTLVSDTELILNDLYLWFKDGELNIDILSTAFKTPLNNGLLDYAAGHVMRMSLETGQSSICEIPFADKPELLTGSCDIVYNYNCDPATVTNSNESLIVYAQSGSLTVLEDINITTGSGLLISPSAVDINLSNYYLIQNPTGERVPMPIPISDPNTRVAWLNKTSNTTTSLGSIKKNINAGDAYNAGGIFNIATLGDFRIEYTFNGTGSVSGLSFSDTGFNFENVSYGFYIQNGNYIDVVENGNFKGVGQNITPGIMMKIERIGNLIKYYVSNVLIRTTTLLSPDPLSHGYMCFDCSIYGAGTELYNLKLTFL